MRLKTVLFTVIATIAVGCTDISRMTASFQHLVTSSVDDLATRRLLDDPIYVDAPGPMSVDIVSFNGSVEIEARPDLERAVILIERLATHGYGRKWEADASLAEIFYTIDVVPGELGPSLVIRTGTNHAEPHFQRVRLNIALPEINGVAIHTNNGDVVARHVQGPVDIVTNDGDVRVITMLPMLEPVSIINADGDIDYRVRAESTGAIDAEAERGQVTHFTRRGAMVVERSTDQDTLRATLNDGTNPIYLRTSDGDIRLSVVENPEDVGVIIRH